MACSPSIRWRSLAALVALVGGSLACGPEAAPLEPADEAALIDDLVACHRRVYEVYGLGLDRDAIHDHLARSFAGEALTREYVEHFTTLARMERSGTRVEILDVDYPHVQLLDAGPQGARLEAEWVVTGIVTHRGHSHARVNRYEAVFTVTGREEGARIVATRMKDLERLRSARGDYEEWARGRAGGGEARSLSELVRSGGAAGAADPGSGAAGTAAPPAPGAEGGP